MASAGRSPQTARSGRRSRKSSDAWTRPLWPVHLKPQPGEVLSSWLMRLAHAHGLKVQTFDRLVFGGGFQLWNRDIDRLAPDWLLDTLCTNTATPMRLAREATLRTYEGLLYPYYHGSHVLKWITLVKTYSTRRNGYAMQFCPRCLAEDDDPYFRTRWRVACYTWCGTHNVMLHDRCPSCGVPVIFHRRELGKPKQVDGGALCQCHACDFDLREALTSEPTFYDESAMTEWRAVIGQLECPAIRAKVDVDYFTVLHQLCRLLAGRYRKIALLEFACRQLRLSVRSLETDTRMMFEGRPLDERHYILQLAFWLMASLEERLTSAWQSSAITGSALLRDLREIPEDYERLAVRLFTRRVNSARGRRHMSDR